MTQVFTFAHGGPPFFDHSKRVEGDNQINGAEWAFMPVSTASGEIKVLYAVWRCLENTPCADHVQTTCNFWAVINNQAAS